MKRLHAPLLAAALALACGLASAGPAAAHCQPGRYDRTGTGTLNGIQDVLCDILTDGQGQGVLQNSVTAGQTGGLVQGAVTNVAPTYVSGHTSPLSLTTGGALRVSDTGTSSISTFTGAMATAMGAKTDAAAASDTGTYSQIALTKRQLQSLTSIYGSVDGLEASNGAPADTAATTDTGTFSQIALQKRGLQSLTSIYGSVDGLEASNGAPADTAATTDTGTFSQIALQKRGLQTLTSIHGDLDGVEAGLGTAADSAATTDTGTFSLISLHKRLLQTATVIHGDLDGVQAVLPSAVGPRTPTDSLSVTKATPASYSATTGFFNPVASASDIFVIGGSGTKTVRIDRISVSACATSTAVAELRLFKRSTADTGGTSSSLTAVPLDSTSAAATATVASYTANPTAGTLTGILRATVYTWATCTSPAFPAQLLVHEFGHGRATELVLRGTAEQVSVNLGGSTPTGASVSITVEWTEE
jgi:hypothetical protein